MQKKHELNIKKRRTGGAEVKATIHSASNQRQPTNHINSGSFNFNYQDPGLSYRPSSIPTANSLSTVNTYKYMLQKQQQQQQQKEHQLKKQQAQKKKKLSRFHFQSDPALTYEQNKVLKIQYLNKSLKSAMSRNIPHSQFNVKPRADQKTEVITLSDSDDSDERPSIRYPVTIEKLEEGKSSFLAGILVRW